MADPFRSSRYPLGDGRYKFTFTFGSGKKIEFTSYPHEWRTQLNWQLGGNQGIAPKILADRQAEADKREEEQRRKILDERPHLDYDPEFHYSRVSDYLEPGIEEPSGLTIAQRKRLNKMRSSYPKP